MRVVNTRLRLRTLRVMTNTGNGMFPPSLERIRLDIGKRIVRHTHRQTDRNFPMYNKIKENT
jgi:hypothetical protein